MACSLPFLSLFLIFLLNVQLDFAMYSEFYGPIYHVTTFFLPWSFRVLVCNLLPRKLLKCMQISSTNLNPSLRWRNLSPLPASRLDLNHIRTESRPKSQTRWSAQNTTKDLSLLSLRDWHKGRPDKERPIFIGRRFLESSNSATLAECLNSTHCSTLLHPN